jgi:hypothetical protein
MADSHMDINRFLDCLDYRSANIGIDSRYIGTCYVTAFEKEQGYGGPEEGGWWFDVLTPIASIQVRNKSEAIAAYNFLVKQYAEDYKDERPYYSAAGGVDFIITIEDEIAPHYPKEHPRYE